MNTSSILRLEHIYYIIRDSYDLSNVFRFVRDHDIQSHIGAGTCPACLFFKSDGNSYSVHKESGVHPAGNRYEVSFDEFTACMLNYKNYLDSKGIKAVDHISQVYVSVPFVQITEVLLETAKANGLDVSHDIKDHTFLFCNNGKIHGAYLFGDFTYRKEVGVNEFMQLIVDQNKKISIKLNDSITVNVSNKGKLVTFNCLNKKDVVVTDKDIETLKYVIEHQNIPTFKSGDYCVFPSADIRIAFAKEAKSNRVKTSVICEQASNAVVLFYEGPSNCLWMKQDEKAYLGCDISSIVTEKKKITMDEFSACVMNDSIPSSRIAGHDVSMLDAEHVNIGCQTINVKNIEALFGCINHQKNAVVE